MFILLPSVEYMLSMSTRSEHAAENPQRPRLKILLIGRAQLKEKRSVGSVTEQPKP